MSSELGSVVVANASRVLGEIGYSVAPDIGQPAADGMYLYGVDPYTGMPERPQRRWPHSVVNASGDLVLRSVHSRYDG